MWKYDGQGFRNSGVKRGRSVSRAGYSGVHLHGNMMGKVSATVVSKEGRSVTRAGYSGVHLHGNMMGKVSATVVSKEGRSLTRAGFT